MKKASHTTLVKQNPRNLGKLILLTIILLIGTIGFAIEPVFGLTTDNLKEGDSDINWAQVSNLPRSNVALVIDDGQSESATGYLFGNRALQFMWFNRFEPDSSEYPFALTRVEIQWLADVGSKVGDNVDIYIWEDDNNNPKDGATLLDTINGTVQSVQGDFSTYTLDSPLVFCSPNNVLIGVVDRSVVSYVTGPKWPARRDTHTVTDDNSWLATYDNDPTNPPELDSGNVNPIDYGTWMIRGHGSTVSQTNCISASATINYSRGSVGSYFKVSGEGFPADTQATISVNGQTLGTAETDGSGNLDIILSTQNSDEGRYIVTISVNPTASVSFDLDNTAPTRPQEGQGTSFIIPDGIAFSESVFLPIVVR